MLDTQVCELNLVFAFCLCTKLYPIYEHFQHPVYARFISGWNVTVIIFRVLTFCWSWPVFFEAVAQD